MHPGRRGGSRASRLRSSPLSQVENDRNRPIVDQLDLHESAEPTGLDAHSVLAQRSTEALVERLGQIGLSGLAETGPVTLPGIRCPSDVNRRIAPP